MPGTIHVSILELSGLPSVSPSSSITIKVSLGKQTFETVDKGDFSFPLVTLKDSLIVVVQDNEGNELAQTGVQTRLIVEKGSWDDSLAFEGGGRVHMRLRFVLNDEERQRIRAMRESALKKKQEELLKMEHEQSETSPSSDGSHNNIHQSNSEDMKHADEQPGDVSRSSSSPKTFSIPYDDQPNEAVPSHTDSREETLYDEASNQPEHPESTGAANELMVPSEVAQVSQQSNPEKESPLEKTSSNVRKMITAFESSLSKLVITPNEYLSTLKTESIGRRVVVSAEGSDVSTTCTVPENTETVKVHNERESDPSAPSTYTTIEEEIASDGGSCQQRSFDNTDELRSQSHDQSYSEDKSINVDPVDEKNLEQRSLQEFDGLSMYETSSSCTVPENTETVKAHGERKSDPFVPSAYMTIEEEIVADGASCQQRSFDNTYELRSQSLDQRYSEDNESRNVDAVDEKNMEQRSLEEFNGLSVSETSGLLGTPDHVLSGENRSSDCVRKEDGSNDMPGIKRENHEDFFLITVKLSQVPHEEVHYSADGSCNWIPLEDRMCSSTVSASTPVIDLPCGCPSEMSAEDNEKLVGMSITQEEQGEISIRMKKPEPVGNSKGPMGQAIKIGIMIGFGLFILLTRKRKPRKCRK